MKTWRIAGVLGITVLIAVFAAEAAEDVRHRATDKAETSSESESGRGLYLAHCAACHGAEAKGDGPDAGKTKPAPTNLTRLSAGNGGVYPAAKVADVIRTGGGVLGHGSTDMPSWAKPFGVLHRTEVARTRVGALVEYLRSLQGP